MNRVAAACLTLAALLAAAGFTALGSGFDYPAILQEPTGHILALYRSAPVAVSGWFGVLVVGAALLAPAAVALGRLYGSTAIAVVGVAAAVVQVIGLSRWVLVVPFLARDGSEDAQRTFETLHFWLGQMIGETLGYALTAVFTLLVARRFGRWLALSGVVAAVLVATGVLVPLGVELARLTNFAGYVVWCVWLIAVAVALVTARTAARAPHSSGRR
ncbi:uncharacterized protein DUF4386 [Actinomycetospora succinea]|uniref:Uncharacterized protein DUF4386 n=1 Tax=Actinomycetospora succinea TaxID=663603 RepID=A0A4R6VQU0_9PSEU|nr:DUF4386 family protein [Actinomycetospora succinea]TDQ64926.1 uncharacterized protein DUF4386 [Actinomycetospora succinea]